MSATAMNPKLSDREALRMLIEARMASGQPFTYSALWGPLTHPTINVSRLTDQCLQRWRKRGWVAFRREGARVVWSMTDAGRAAVANG
jgi:hypothetical protein